MSTLEIITIVLMVLFGITGFISGLVKKIGTIAAVVAGLVVAFFVASPINNNIFVKTEFFTDTVVGWFGSDSTASIVSLIVIWLIAFIVVFLFVWFIFRTLKKLIEKAKILGVVDRILGLVFGAAFGLVLGTVIIIVVAYIGSISDGVYEWLQADIYESGSGFIQWIFETLVPIAQEYIPAVA